MSARRLPILRGLANALLAGPWERRAMSARVVEALGFGGIWVRTLVNDVLVEFPVPPHHARDALAAAIDGSRGIRELLEHERFPHRLRHWIADTAQMAPHRWPVAQIETLGDLALWLNVTTGQLEWFADRRGLEGKESRTPLQNYNYRWRMKPDGGARLLEAPKSRLKMLQRKVLSQILDAVPAHDAAHAFRSGRSVLTHARLHVGHHTVVRFDLESFFASIPRGRILGLFDAAGYPEEVARSLAGLCTNSVPRSVLRQLPRPSSPHLLEARFRLHQYLSGHHLPQGAPTSPALANLCAYQLDIRLTALANRLGATYSRYADDLTFSGDRTLARMAPPLTRWVREIARDESFVIHERKTRVMTRRMRQEVTGVVVNERLGIARADYDRLKATLHNCAVRGPVTQSAHGDLPLFRQQLLGKVSWVEQVHPERGVKLRALFDRIVWPGA